MCGKPGRALQKALQEQRQFCSRLLAYRKDVFLAAAPLEQKRRMQRNAGVRGWHSRSACCGNPPPPPTIHRGLPPT